MRPCLKKGSIFVVSRGIVNVCLSVCFETVSPETQTSLPMGLRIAFKTPSPFSASYILELQGGTITVPALSPMPPQYNPSWLSTLNPLDSTSWGTTVISQDPFGNQEGLF